MVADEARSPQTARVVAFVTAGILLVALLWAGVRGSEQSRDFNDQQRSLDQRKEELDRREQDLADREDVIEARRRNLGDGRLKIGFLHRGDEGVLQASSPQLAEAAGLAVSDINAAGDVFGADVELIVEVNGNLEEGVDNLLEQNVDAILSSVPSDDALRIVHRITDAGVIHFSSNNTSPLLTEVDELFFRNAPSDLLQGQVLANEVKLGGNQTAAVIFEDGNYAQPLAASFLRNFEVADRTIKHLVRLADDRLNERLRDLAADPPDAIVVVGYPERSAEVVERLDALGVGPKDGIDLWGVDANVRIADFTSRTGILDGMRRIYPSSRQSVGDPLPAIDLSTAFTLQTYDAVVTLALAANAAAEDHPLLIANSLIGVTRDGELCNTFQECSTKIANGTDVDYAGLGGDYDLDDAGDLCAATYLIDALDGTGSPSGSVPKYVDAKSSIVDELNRFQISFPLGSSDLGEDALIRIQQLGALLRDSQEVIQIQGYADTTGPSGPSFALSEERAEAVRSHLLEVDGVSGENLEARGYGQTEQFGDDAANRLVRFERISGESTCGG